VHACPLADLWPNDDVEKVSSAHPAVNQIEYPVEVPLVAQSDLQAKALQSGHPDAGGMYHATVRLSLEPDRHFLGLRRRWGFYEKAVGSACRNVCFRKFRTVTFDT
jgi:hypothetical protein